MYITPWSHNTDYFYFRKSGLVSYIHATNVKVLYIPCAYKKHPKVQSSLLPVVIM